MKLLDSKRKAVIDELLEIKVTMKESDKGKRIEKLNQYIEDRLVYYKDAVVKRDDDRNTDWNELNSMFSCNIL